MRGGVGAGRLVLGAVGVAGVAWGGWLLVTSQDGAQLRDAAVWLLGGVLLHDLVLAPLTLLVVALGARVLPGAWRAPAAVGLVVLAPLTLLAVPVLGRFGARPDNPTLLDRPYAAGWLLVAGLVVLAVLVAGAVRRRRHAAPRS